MILSMTGFGQGKENYSGKVIRVEIKSLNARSTEIRCKLPAAFRDREMDIRKKSLMPCKEERSTSLSLLTVLLTKKTLLSMRMLSENTIKS